MQEITRVNHFGLRVRSLEVARAFYERLGFRFIVGPVGPEPVAVVEHDSGVNINLILNASDDAAPQNVLMDEKTKHTGFTRHRLVIFRFIAAPSASPFALPHCPGDHRCGRGRGAARRAGNTNHRARRV